METPVSVFLPPALPEAVVMQALNVRGHREGQVTEGRKGRLQETLTQSDAATYLHSWTCRYRTVAGGMDL